MVRDDLEKIMRLGAGVTKEEQGSRMLGNGEGDGRKGEEEKGKRDKVKRREGKIATRKRGEEYKKIKKNERGNLKRGKEKDERGEKGEDENGGIEI